MLFQVILLTALGQATSQVAQRQVLFPLSENYEKISLKNLTLSNGLSCLLSFVIFLYLPRLKTLFVGVNPPIFSASSHGIFTPLRVGWPPTPQVYFGP